MVLQWILLSSNETFKIFNVEKVRHLKKTCWVNYIIWHRMLAKIEKMAGRLLNFGKYCPVRKRRKGAPSSIPGEGNSAPSCLWSQASPCHHSLPPQHPYHSILSIPIIPISTPLTPHQHPHHYPLSIPTAPHQHPHPGSALGSLGCSEHHVTEWEGKAQTPGHLEVKPTVPWWRLHLQTCIPQPLTRPPLNHPLEPPPPWRELKQPFQWEWPCSEPPSPVRERRGPVSAAGMPMSPRRSDHQATSNLSSCSTI